MKKLQDQERQPIRKSVKFDFLQAGTIGCIHVQADCYTLEDYEEALEFAKKASQLIPPRD